MKFKWLFIKYLLEAPATKLEEQYITEWTPLQ